MSYNPPKPEPVVAGEITCPACGAKTPVKVNKNGILYVYCHNEINEETGEKCCHRITWGRAASRKFLKENNIEVLNNGTRAKDIIANPGNNDNSAGEQQSYFAAIWG